MSDICNLVTDIRFVYAVDEKYVRQRLQIPFLLYMRDTLFHDMEVNNWLDFWC